MASEKERDPGSASAEIGKYLGILAKDQNSRVFAPLAEAYRKAGLLDDAVETAREGLKVHPNYLGGRVALGRAYFEKKQYGEAAAEMQKVAKAAPDNIIAHKVLGQIASSQRDFAVAEKAFRMVLLLDPRDQEAQQFVANLAAEVPAPVQVSPIVPPPPQPLPVPQQMPPPMAVIPSSAAQPPPPLPAPLPPEPFPFEDIQAIEDLDLPADIPVPPAPEHAVAAPWTNNEQTIFGEIDLESAAPEPEQREQEPDTDSPFEIFTREPGVRAAPAPPKAERGKAVARETDLETTAYTPPDTYTPDGVDAPVSGVEPELGLNFEFDQALELEPAAHIETDSAEAPFVEEDEDAFPDEEPPEPAAGRGVFDTETLASIYINQGFYGRAAEIYQRLISQRPDDAGLRRKLEGLLARERGEIGGEEPAEAGAAAVGQPPSQAIVAPAQGEPAAPLRVGRDQMVDQLQTLLETFREGWPR